MSSQGQRIPGGASLSLLALLGGQLLLIYLLQLSLAEVLVTKPEYLYLQVLPGLAWPLAFAWLFGAWQARRTPGSTALPLGFSLSAALWLVAAVLHPIFRQGVAQGMSAERSGNLAWSAGVALTVMVGVCQILLAPVARRLIAGWSGPLCLSLGAAAALVSIGLYLPWLMENPLVSISGLIALVAFVQVGIPKPFGLSAGWLALGAGCLAQLASSTSFNLPELPGSLLPNWQWNHIKEGMNFLWVQPEFLSGALPLLLGSLARDLVLLREAQEDTHPPSVGQSLFGMGCLNLLGALLGCGLPLGLLPGFLGFRRLGGGQIYSQAAGLLLVLLCLSGAFSQVVGWLPLPTLGVLLAGQLLLAGSHSLNRLGAAPGYLLAASWLPMLAADSNDRWVVSPVALLVGLIWGGIATAVRRQHFVAASWVCIAGSLLSMTGLLHGRGWTLDFDAFSGAYLTLAIVFHVGYLLKAERAQPAQRAVDEPPAADDEQILVDSSESLGRMPFDTRADTQSAEGAGSGSAS